MRTKLYIFASVLLLVTFFSLSSLDPQTQSPSIIDHMQNDETPFTDDPLNQESEFKKANKELSTTSRNDGTRFSDDQHQQPEAPSSWYDTPQCEEKDGGFCTKVTNYPNLSGLRDTILADFTKFQMFFGVDAAAQPVNITQRINTDPDEEFLCRSETKVIFPQSGRTKDAGSVFIVNNNAFKQGVRVEQCMKEGSTCDSRLMLPIDYEATCKQLFTFRSLLAIENGIVKRDQFRIPSCCKCVMKKRNW